MKFVGTHLTWQGASSVHFEAETWEEAEEYCQQRGILLEGKLMATVYDEDTANSIIFDLESNKLQNNRMLQ